MNANNMKTVEPRAAIEVTELSRTFRGRTALDQVSLRVPVGSVFGLVGLNGAGKTTLIRHLIGGLKPQAGSVVVLGGDPIRDRVEVLRRVGYLSEEDSLPKWATVGELMRFFRGVQPSWDPAYADQLADMFRLSPNDKLASLSKGGRARVGLLVAIAHRPELLILDEPSSGLDPIARGDILEAIIRTVNEDGRTVLFSSHLLDEVDRVCDAVAMIHEGRFLETLTTEQLQHRYVEVMTVREGANSDDAALAATAFPTAFGWESTERESSAVILKEDIGDHGQADGWKWETRPISLQRWFTARVRDRQRGSASCSTINQTNAPESSHA